MGQVLIVEFGGEVFRTEPLSWMQWAEVIGFTSLLAVGGENGYFTRGYAAAGGDFRFIVAHGGDTITLQLPFDSRVGNGGTVTAYPGCDGSPATCRDRFGNSARFGGCASIPSRNPAVWGFK